MTRKATTCEYSGRLQQAVLEISSSFIPQASQLFRVAQSRLAVLDESRSVLVIRDSPIGP
jgi:hypothetical protein